jgi:SAM-dependent methyltransferase
MTSASDPTFFQRADAYERFMGRYSHPLALEFARATGVRAREHVLDVGCGTGALTAVLADLVGPDLVAAVDPSEPFVEKCRANVPGADVRVGSAEALPFGDETFDRTLSQLVFHFVDDTAASVAEMARVTRVGGLVGACVWDFADGMTMLRSYWEVVRELDPGEPGEAVRFGSRRGELAELWRDAGLRDVTDAELVVSARYADFAELWESFLGGIGPAGAHAVSLDQPTRDAVREAFNRRIGSPDGPFDLTARAWYAAGIV